MYVVNYQIKKNLKKIAHQESTEKQVLMSNEISKLKKQFYLMSFMVSSKNKSKTALQGEKEYSKILNTSTNTINNLKNIIRNGR
jgi:hypothetical protein